MGGCLKVREVHSKARIPLLARGSTFRFAGRVLAEIKEEDDPHRDQPNFVRYHLERQPSRQERGFPWMNKYSTLPRLRPKPTGEEALPPRAAEAPDSLPILDEETLFTPRDGPSPVCDLQPLDEPPALPLHNSTPVKPETELRARKLETTAKSNGAASTAAVKTTDKKKTEPQPQSAGMCRRALGWVLTAVMVTMMVAGVVAAVMELTDSDPVWRRRSHAVPGLEAFRYQVEDPSA